MPTYKIKGVDKSTGQAVKPITVTADDEADALDQAAHANIAVQKLRMLVSEEQDLYRAAPHSEAERLAPTEPQNTTYEPGVDESPPLRRPAWQPGALSAIGALFILISVVPFLIIMSENRTVGIADITLCGLIFLNGVVIIMAEVMAYHLASIRNEITALRLDQQNREYRDVN